MNKNIIIPVIFVFIISISGYADGLTSKEREKLPLITGIGFIDGNSYKPSAPPKELILGIDITNNAHYKLLYKDKMIKGDRLTKGSNRIGIESQHLFKASGTHLYILETKAGQFKFKYEITIDIALDAPPPPKISLEIETIKPFQYETEMYIDGRLAVKTRKKVYGVISDSMRRDIKRAMESTPQNPAAVTNPNSIATFQIPLSAILDLFKRGKASPLPKPRRISLSFREKDKSGTQKKVNAEIKLQYRILKHPDGVTLNEE